MKQLFFILMTLLLGTALHADPVDLSDQVDGYDVRLYTETTPVVGNNDFYVTITKEGNKVKNLKVKIKFFMPEMPGMPYMEYKAKGMPQADGSFKLPVNFSMGGTWQYHLKFKTKDDAVHKIRGSVTL